jgi:hypothetical protein
VVDCEGNGSRFGRSRLYSSFISGEMTIVTLSDRSVGVLGSSLCVFCVQYPESRSHRSLIAPNRLTISSQSARSGTRSRINCRSMTSRMSRMKSLAPSHARILTNSCTQVVSYYSSPASWQRYRTLRTEAFASTTLYRLSKLKN